MRPGTFGKIHPIVFAPPPLFGRSSEVADPEFIGKRGTERGKVVVNVFSKSNESMSGEKLAAFYLLSGLNC